MLGEVADQSPPLQINCLARLNFSSRKLWQSRLCEYSQRTYFGKRGRVVRRRLFSGRELS